MSRDWSYVGDAARLREAAEKALEAMENNLWAVMDQAPAIDVNAYHAAIVALRAALAEPPRKIRASTCVFPQCVSTTRTTCDAWASGACEERI